MNTPFEVSESNILYALTATVGVLAFLLLVLLMYLAAVSPSTSKASAEGSIYKRAKHHTVRHVEIHEYEIEFWDDISNYEESI